MSKHTHTRSDLAHIAADVMVERGLQPEFPPAVLRQLEGITGPARDSDPGIRDLRHLRWCSIDNDDSRDLDQLTASEVLSGGAVRVLVAIADVDALVARGSPIDDHAYVNTTSVYTGARIFPMLPERLSTDLTSLNPGQDRLALVTEMVFNPDASLAGSEVYRARVHNRAQLDYDAVSAGMADELRTQDAVVQQLRARRRAQGALEFQTFRPRAVFADEQVVEIRQQEQNRAREYR